MRQNPRPVKEPAEQVMKDISRATRRRFSAEGKIRILEGLRGEESIAELRRREGIVQNLSYRSKVFLEAGKKRVLARKHHQSPPDQNLMRNQYRNHHLMEQRTADASEDMLLDS